MVIRRLATILALPAVASSASAGVCRHDNLMPAFLTFERPTRDLAPDQRANLFVNDIAAMVIKLRGQAEAADLLFAPLKTGQAS